MSNRGLANTVECRTGCSRLVVWKLAILYKGTNTFMHMMREGLLLGRSIDLLFSLYFMSDLAFLFFVQCRAACDPDASKL